MTNNESNHDVIIIGAGVAGLTAALHLAERGLKPLVLEADPQYVGGRLASKGSVEINGQRFPLEHGVHGIWAQYRNLNAMLARHNLRPTFIPAEEETWIYLRHGVVDMSPIGAAIRRSWFPAPLHYFQLFLDLRFLGMLDLRDWLALPFVWGGLIMGVGVDPWRENQPLEGWTLARLTRRWSPALKALFLGLARNGLSAHPDEVSLSGFLAFLRFYTILRRDAWNFAYAPEDGGTAICEPLAERIRQLGGEIRLGRRVIRVARKNESWRVAWNTANESGYACADHIILATDSPAAKNILLESFGAAVDQLYFPRALSNAIVRLWFDAEPRRGSEAGIFTGDFMLHNYFWLDRFYNPYRRWARATGGSVLEAHIYGPPEVLAEPDALLLSKAMLEVFRVWPELKPHRIGQHLQRNPETHTLPSVGPAEKHLGIETPWPNLFCAGDWVQHRNGAFFIERACVTGMEAANAVLRSHKLQEWALVPHLPPEPFAAWIERLMVNGRQRIRARRAKRTQQATTK